MESAAVTIEPDKRGRRARGLPARHRVVAARTRLLEAGETAREWALRNGHDPETTYKVLSGKRPCTTGASLKIAIALGIRDAEAA